MHFTYDAYSTFMGLLREHGYKYASYHDWTDYPRCVILRHDIDRDISRALDFAKLEADLQVRSTYFVRVRSDMYNAFSCSSMKMLREILRYGHTIGLHFDEMNYPEAIGNPEKVSRHILEEARLLENVIGSHVTCVSMHRPNKEILAADIEIPGMVNSYGKIFFHIFKYMSDSRRHWRAPVEKIVKNEEYDRLHILTHAFLYRKEKQDMFSILETFINSANYERYKAFRDDFTNLEEFITENDVKGYTERQ